MARIPKPTPPTFEPKGKKPAAKKPAKKTPKAKPAPKEIEAPEELPVRPARRVTAGPYHDDRARTYEAWTVITRTGAIIEYHRFRTKDDADAFADIIGR